MRLERERGKFRRMLLCLRSERAIRDLPVLITGTMMNAIGRDKRRIKLLMVRGVISSTIVATLPLTRDKETMDKTSITAQHQRFKANLIINNSRITESCFPNVSAATSTEPSHSPPR